MPPETVLALQFDVNRHTVRSALAALGQEIPPVEQLTPQALGAFQKAEIEKWWPIVKDAGIKAE